MERMGRVLTVLLVREDACLYALTFRNGTGSHRLESGIENLYSVLLSLGFFLLLLPAYAVEHAWL
jgi:hypothetical protein